MSEVFSVLPKVPCRVTVEEIRSSRYAPGGGGPDARPADWDKRLAGIDVVTTTNGELLRLRSTGQQSPPHKGWVILITSGTSEDGYEWTLYGMPHGADLSGLRV